jgi:hypothetical protein
MKTIYKFKQPIDDGDEQERLTLIEDRGDRVLVESNTILEGLKMRPQSVYLKSELMEVKE